MLAHVSAVVPKFIRVLELTRVTIARTRKQHEDRTCGDLHLADGGLGARQPEVALDRALHPQTLFEKHRNLRTIIAKHLLNVGTLAHYSHPGTEQLGSR